MCSERCECGDKIGHIPTCDSRTLEQFRQHHQYCELSYKGMRGDTDKVVVRCAYHAQLIVVSYRLSN